eukprot:gene23382-31722_t
MSSLSPGRVQEDIYKHANNHHSIPSLFRLRMADAVCHELLEDSNVCGLSLSGWNYWFYEKGMQTSTDDVLVALVALYGTIPTDCDNNNDLLSLSKRFQRELTSGSSFHYIDLGCGVGSILFLVSHGLLRLQYELSPIKGNNIRVCSIGLEVQEVSAELATRSASALPVFPGVFQPNVSIQRMDIRDIPRLLSEGIVSDNPSQNYLQSLKGKCNLLTANPPYFPRGIGTHSGDSQLRNARFELHGGIEEYCLAARELLCPENGLFVFSFCTSAVSASDATVSQCSDQRVRRALALAGLKLTRRTMVLAGRWDSSEPMGCVYEAVVASQGEGIDDAYVVEERQLDIRRMEASNRLNPLYYSIQRALNMAPRPLKRRKRIVHADDAADPRATT